MKILITGGAGFVGSSLALAFKEKNIGSEVTVLDNLKRRGSELNLPRLKRAGVQFLHGDVRTYNDLESLTGTFDLLIEASAEPSVLAGSNGNPWYLLDTNLRGTINCLEFARKRVERTVFLSTSRVYSIAPLRSLNWVETNTRFLLADQQQIVGSSIHGIREEFPVNSARSLYGASKLASELLLQEYVHSYNMKAAINRCGVIAGPGQFGKVDQGVFTLWVANHFLGKPLKYLGFGGSGKQVRDLLHPRDLFDLLQIQLKSNKIWDGEIFNVGGGNGISVSLKEMTVLCREATGREVPIDASPESHSVDIPIYISDCSKAAQSLGWKPKTSASDIVSEIAVWLKENSQMAEQLF